MSNLKEFIINNLIKGVKNKSFSKEYASILAVNYLIKGILNEEDIQKFDLETTEVVEENVEQTIETVEEIPEEVIEETPVIEETEENPIEESGV